MPLVALHAASFLQVFLSYLSSKLVLWMYPWRPGTWSRQQRSSWPRVGGGVGRVVPGSEPRNDGSHDDEAPFPTLSTRPGTDQSRLRRHYGQRRGRMLQIISPSARTGFGVPSTGGGGTSTAFTVASGADSITVTSPISMPFTYHKF